MAVLVRNKRAGVTPPGGGAGAGATAADGKPAARRLKPTFVYEESFDTVALGERLLALTEPVVWKGFANIALDWVVIVAIVQGCLALGRAVPWAFWPAWFVSIFFVAGRMHALLIMMHDAAHQRLLPNRVWNDRLANWLCAFPGFVSVEAYRKEHLIHHFYVNTDKDPNWISKKDDPEWAFPKTKGALALIFLKEFLGFGLLRMARYVLNYGKQAKKAAERRGDGKARLTERLGYYALAATLITLAGGWSTVLLFWIVPFISILPAILRARILAEHHGLPRTNDLTHSRNYHVTLLERMLIAPHNIHLHVVHHVFPAIPCYNVALAHELLKEIPEYVSGAAESDTILSPGRLSVLRDLTEPEARKALAA